MNFSRKKPVMKAFLISLSSLIIVIGIILSVLYSTSRSNSVDSTVSDITIEWSPREDEIVNVLFVVCPTRAKPADIFILTQFNPITQAVSITCIPAEAVSTVNVKTMNLTEHYNYGSTRTVMRAVNNLFHLETVKFVRISDESFEKFVNLIGGFEYNVSTDIQYMNSDTGEQTHIPAGNQTIDGRRLIAIMRSKDESTTSIDHANAITTLLCSMLNQRFNATTSSSLSIYETMVNEIDTNFSNADYLMRRESWSHLLQLDKQLFQPIYLTGTQSKKGEVTFDKEMKETIKNIFTEKTSSESN